MNNFYTCSTHFFRLGQSPVKNKLCSCAHTYTCTFTARVYTSPYTCTFTCARAQALAEIEHEHTIEICVGAVCAHVHAPPPPGRPASNKNGVVLCVLWWTSRSTVEICSWRKTIAWCPCTPLATLETLGGKIITCTCSSKEIAGLNKKKEKNIMMMMMMTRNSWIRVWPFSRVENWRQVWTCWAYVWLEMGKSAVAGVFWRLS